MNWKGFGKSLLAVAAENSLKKQRWSAAAFSAKQSSAADATATEKVAPLVAPAGEQRRCAHHWVRRIQVGDSNLTIWFQSS